MSELNLLPYRGANDQFTALGTETGLFICIDPQLKKWYPPMDDAHASPFEVIVEINDKGYLIEFNGKTMRLKIVNERQSESC